jgi:thioesterase domain-containing protein
MGDLGRLDEQNCLWVLGRKDSQVKIRGYRVETAEVEVALLDLPNVQEAAVIQMGESDESRYLMAFVACHVETSGIALRKQLATRLPDYMVPSTILVLAELPHNANGKVVRPLLREMAVAFAKNAREVSRQPETAARTETESRVLAMMNELLASNQGDTANALTNGPTVGLQDNFFDVGGHSLLAARLMLQIHRIFGVDLSPRDFIAEPTAVALARAIDQRLSTQRLLAQAAEQQRPLRIEAMQMVNGSDDHAPIFLCLGGNGSEEVLLRYQKIIRRLGKQWHLYGLVTTENDDPDGLYRNMEELVNEAMAALRRVRPRGPYLLIGECLGGKLAFELARALEQEGERTLLLALLDARLKRNAANNFSVKTWQERFAYHQQKLAGMNWQGGARHLWDRFVARLPISIYPYPTEHRGHIAQKRYFDLLQNFEPNQGYQHPALGIYTHENEHYLPLWKQLIPRFDLAMVEGTHQEYLYVSGDEVVATLRSALARAEDASKGTLAKGVPLAKLDAVAVPSLPGGD